MVALSRATIILLPSYSCSCWRPEGTFSSEATSRIANPASRSSSAAFSTAQAAFLESFSSFASIAMRPLAAPEAASISITMSPFFPPLAERSSPTWCATSPRAGCQLLDELEGMLLELPALAGAALALRGQLGLGLTRVVEALHLALELGDLLDQPLLRVARALHRLDDGALKSASGLWPSWAENWRSRS